MENYHQKTTTKKKSEDKESEIIMDDVSVYIFNENQENEPLNSRITKYKSFTKNNNSIKFSQFLALPLNKKITEFKQNKNIRNLIEQNSYNSIFHYLCMNDGNLPILKIMKPTSAEINRKNKYDQTLLHISVINNTKNILKFLLTDNNANVNSVDKQKNTPIHYAVSLKNFEIIKLLLEKHAKMTIKNKKGETPIDIAKKLKIKNQIENIYNNKTNKTKKSFSPTTTAETVKMKSFDFSKGNFLAAKNKLKMTKCSSQTKIINKEINNQKNIKNNSNIEKKLKIKNIKNLKFQIPKRETVSFSPPGIRISMPIQKRIKSFFTKNENKKFRTNNTSLSFLNDKKSSSKKLYLDNEKYILTNVDNSNNLEQYILTEKIDILSKPKSKENPYKKIDSIINYMHKNDIEINDIKEGYIDDGLLVILPKKDISTQFTDFRCIDLSISASATNIESRNKIDIINNTENNISKNTNQSKIYEAQKCQKEIHNFLKEINLQKYENTLISQGFDDLKIIIQQTKNNFTISDNVLKEIGVSKPGDRAKILIRLLEISGKFDCSLHSPEMYFDDNDNLLLWLKEIGFPYYINNFNSGGYYNLELIIVQNATDFPFNEEILTNELNIKNKIDRKIILKSLEEIGKLYWVNLKRSKTRDISRTCSTMRKEKWCMCKMI